MRDVWWFVCSVICFFKQKTAYEMRISDWSSDVCSSDLLEPEWVIIENVSALRTRGLDVILHGLAALGYDAEWHCILASSVGAPHPRDRIWVIAYPRSKGLSGPILQRNDLPLTARSDERRVGKECGSKCRSRWSPGH